MPLSSSSPEPVVRHSTPLPAGYVFVPKGNVYITGNCRRQAQATSQTVYAVVNNDKRALGIRVPSNIYASVRAAEANTRQTRASAVQKRDDALERQFCDAVMKQFPKVPAETIPLIVARAMQKGSRRVGRTGTLDVAQKATLAVRAHIRHCHTDYDAILRQGVKKDDARKQTHDKIDKFVTSWGGYIQDHVKGLGKRNMKSSRGGHGASAVSSEAAAKAGGSAKQTTASTPTLRLSKAKGMGPSKPPQSPRERRFHKLENRQNRGIIATPSAIKTARNDIGGSIRKNVLDLDEGHDYEWHETGDDDSDWTPG
ncbi:hypothetical protein BJ170DRAFT_598295 [Xylariales sp. AK1849]|nr:hypothetical protein BJ170DRAFT_598295 [Xylariales sp. AK1849]